MLIESVELTIAHLGLDDLTEPHLMRLFADVHSHRLVQGTGRNIMQLEDAQGRPLYPANFMTHLTVPGARLLEQHRLWDRVAVGVEIKTSGWMVLDATYVLAKEAGELGSDPSLWSSASLPIMRGGAMFVVDRVPGESQQAVPKPGVCADLPRLTRTPPSLNRFLAVRSQGSVDPTFAGPLRSHSPIRYDVVAGRDAAVGPKKHTSMPFASFVYVMDYGERMLLSQASPPVPSAIIDALSVIERETYYFENCQAGDTIQIDIRARIDDCPAELARPTIGGVLTSACELYRERDGALLVASRAKKLLSFSPEQTRTIRDAERILNRFKEPS